MSTLAKPLRNTLENTVKTARDVAETAARAALGYLGVGDREAPSHLSGEQKALRRRLRTHGRQLGDVFKVEAASGRSSAEDGASTRHLVREVAYEHWHRMLFARFLAENHLLMWEPGAPVTLAECAELATDPATALGAKSGWELAGILAARMLPHIFKPLSPTLAVTFAPEHQRALEKLLAGLPAEVFTASDSLGWVYQFWQAKRKDEVNASEVKIGADELPAVTQLFTEPYMVEFLLHNSLGAWWVTRHPEQPCPVPLTYLRRLEDGTPAAGSFAGWPDSPRSFKLLDPCCGSGHFLVAAFLLLTPMRMATEGLSAREAVDAVLRDNLHGLELDPRCVEIAAFALALAAWTYPDAGGYRPLPPLNVACCGLKVSAKVEDWAALVPNDAPHAALLRQEFKLLHAAMQDAPLLGSLLDPWRYLKNDLAMSDFGGLQRLLSEALTIERPQLWNEAEEQWDAAVSAQGLLAAARLLAQRYHLVITNVPYLVFRRQVDKLKKFCENYYSDSCNDLATVFISRCLQLIEESGKVAVVSPQNWLFQSRYKAFRKRLIKSESLNFLARLGSGAFETISGEVVKVSLYIFSSFNKLEKKFVVNLDASEGKGTIEKASLLCTAQLSSSRVVNYLSAPDYRIVDVLDTELGLLSDFAAILHGQNAGDNQQFNRCFWELYEFSYIWRPYQLAPTAPVEFSGRHQIVRWEQESGVMARLAESVKHLNHKAQQWRSGKPNWGKRGVAVSLIGKAIGTLYTGDIYGVSCGVVIPNNKKNLGAIWEFVRSGEFAENLKQIDPSVAISVKTVIAVSFDLERWQAQYQLSYPQGLPEPYSNDPTQWIFHGHPQPATDPLQVAVARLLGYRWPAESTITPDPSPGGRRGQEMELSDEARAWIARCEALAHHVDDDGIACLPPVRGEKSAHQRLLALLIDAWETVQPGSWKPSILDKLLAAADCAGKSLETWLRDKFFEQHCKRFHHRPFIWHVWDGLKDGFAALVNYHLLDAKNLERLIHTYLGDWIRTQEAGVANGIDGAQTRLAAARALKSRLELIYEGEKPYDIFVRWKPLDQQPIGWNPDLNDGVRLNIRPFVTAEVLRHNKPPKLNVKWDKDRGKDVESAPWFHRFNGERINDHHLTLAEKSAARQAKP
ncbi:MAG: N-6 DNA methylase [Gammaproteobacteria bacterium]|nr:N-6 DNA methylase [Gammaproteobacteria bacterium]